MLRNIFHNFRTAAETLSQNKLRALLTSLGIIFGVASVISMMAIGRGAKEEVLKQLQTLGSKNIIIRAKAEESGKKISLEDVAKREKKKYSPGLNLKDAESIKEIIPGVEIVSPEVTMNANILAGDKRLEGSVTGVSPDFFSSGGFETSAGNIFSKPDADSAASVCLIGQELRLRLFGNNNPVGKQLKCGNNWLTIRGVAKGREVMGSSLDFGMHDFKSEVFVPIKTFLLRFADRGKIGPQSRQEMIQIFLAAEEGLPMDMEMKNYHQLDKITIVVKNPSQIREIATIVERMLLRRHNQNEDFEVIVPEVLLKQEQETQATFGIVLILIGSISLLVGGIGIMNIMLASVLERIKEIGVRLAMGATKKDITMQFLSEAVTISLAGGTIGILLGVLSSYLIQRWAEITTIVTVESILISFLVSVSVGLIFGIFPARKASQQDPIVSLRYE